MQREIKLCKECNTMKNIDGDTCIPCKGYEAITEEAGYTLHNMQREKNDTNNEVSIHSEKDVQPHYSKDNNKQNNMKKHFLGFVYGRRIWIEAETEDEAKATLQIIMTPLRLYKNFWKRLKYLLTNK